MHQPGVRSQHTNVLVRAAEYEYATWIQLAIAFVHSNTKKINGKERKKVSQMLLAKLGSKEEIMALKPRHICLLYQILYKLATQQLDHQAHVSLCKICSHLEEKIMGTHFYTKIVFSFIYQQFKSNIWSDQFIEWSLENLISIVGSLSGKQIEHILGLSKDRYKNKFITKLYSTKYIYRMADNLKDNAEIYKINSRATSMLFEFLVKARIGNNDIYNRLIEKVAERNVLSTPNLGVTIDSIAKIGLINRQLYQQFWKQFEQSFLVYLNSNSMFINTVKLHSEKDSAKLHDIANDKYLDRMQRLLLRDLMSLNSREKRYIAIRNYIIESVLSSLSFLWSYTLFIWNHLREDEIRLKNDCFVELVSGLNKTFQENEGMLFTLDRITMEKLHQVNMFCKVYLDNKELKVNIKNYSYDPDKDDSDNYYIRKYIKSNPKHFDPITSYNGFRVEGVIKATGKAVIYNDSTQFFRDTKEYCASVHMKRKLLELKNQPYIEVNYHEIWKKLTESHSKGKKLNLTEYYNNLFSISE
eukprot:TRINITY_DN2463_c0_g1_i2.p1 TRINITY_DN2463_c0_g1~~TRINITY_DN2463_c0_g1_i2.p1  ORF type:complete len:527 (+),score=30.00 TRINITY_DN2463_c0_g1_i2:818-2398(+)